MKPEHLKRLRDKHFRLNNLYFITNKQGKKVRFRMTAEQLEYFNGLHTRNIILKARQLGFTTEQCIIQLDAALFESAKCALIAHTLNDAKRLFREKIKYAHDNLPAEIKLANPARNDAAGELVFAKGGSLYVSTSFRGGTLRYLHVSEFGKICAKFPHKAREIVTGAFEAVATDCFVTIESTAEGRAGYFFEYSQTAEKQAASKQPLGQLDWKFFFFSWWKNPEYSIEPLATLPTRLVDYFNELEGKYGIKLTAGQKAWYHAKEKTLGDDMKREYPSIPAEAFQQSVEGAYYAKQFAKLYAQQRIGELPDNSHQPVHTFWDIGVGDSTAIWFVRFIGEQYHVIDYYENSGEGLRHYMKTLKDRGYTYGDHWGPHDIDNREFGSDGKTRREIAREGYEIDGEKYSIKFKVVPKLGIDDGIDQAREILPHCVFNQSTCEEGISCLENYRKEWDDKRGCWKDKPLHDWTSHGCLVAGSMVETARGHVAIESVAVGDDVVLADGGYGKVTHSGLIKHSSTLIISLSDGSVLECSPEHKIFTSRGVLTADALRYNDVVSTRKAPLWNIKKLMSAGLRDAVIEHTAKINSGCGSTETYSSHKRAESNGCCTEFFMRKGAARLVKGMKSIQSLMTGLICRPATGASDQETQAESKKPSTLSKSSTGSGSITSPTDTLSADGSTAGTLCTGMCGYTIMGRSLKGFMSTISITTKQITESRIWKLCLRQATLCTMQKITSGSEATGIRRKLPWLGEKPSSGINHQKELNGTSSTASGHGKTGKCTTNLAKCAVTRTQPHTQTEANTVPINAVRVVSVIESGSIKPVYDLTVDKHHAYHANGMLVSNSDAFRYFAVAMSRRKRTGGMRKIGGLG